MVRRYLSKNLKPKHITTILLALGSVLIVLTASFHDEGTSASEDHGNHGHDEHGHDEHGHDEHDAEGGIELSEEIMDLNGIKTETVSEQRIVDGLTLHGLVTYNGEAIVTLRARFPGLVKKVNVNLGDLVSAGQALAVIEANGTLSHYPITSRFSGTVVDKDAIQGEFASENSELFVVADLNKVWVELSVPERDYRKVEVGQSILVKESETGLSATAKITYVSPVIYKDSQTFLARAVLDNKDGKWRPGSFISTVVASRIHNASLAVKREAIQMVAGRKVVFVYDVDKFVARPIIAGLEGDEFVEIKGGLKVGERYVSSNSFVLKADLLKSEAGHDHGH